MKTFNEFEQIINDAQLSVAIVGNPEASRFALIDTAAPPLQEQTRAALIQSDCRFLGVVGLVGGAPRVAFTEPLEGPIMEAISRAFLSFVEKEINRRVIAQGGDSIAWLQRLYTLPDMRRKHEA
ncbi:MAG: hypothetical protein ACRD3Q_18270 [Terriglobales bacterium]